MSGFLDKRGSWVQWATLPEPLLQFLAQLTELGDAGFDQAQFVLQQLGDSAFRVLGQLEHGHAVPISPSVKPRRWAIKCRSLIRGQALLQGEVQEGVQIWYSAIWLKNEHVAAG
ncbi:hypothetical protein HK44_018285 [Pseudomonas fluorescens HK44]|uniref:Uncharacterized protein n=1 Tax=Pseudomonas fluorescens HK44 TaxID=1042209 RepID=A0A010SK32_PSEFL|nr:hypothetical protein HK44_018285 [Pseudomonas fluorescens HK44]